VFAGLAFLVLRFPVLSWLLSLVAPYMMVRLLLLASFCPYIVLAWALARPRDDSRPTGRWRAWLRPAAIGVCALVVVVAIPGVSATFVDSPSTLRRGAGAAVGPMWERDVRFEWGDDALGGVRAEVGTSYPIVASDATTGYELAALEPISVVAVPGPHSPFFMETPEGSGATRRADMATLMRPLTSEAVRRTILDRYGADYVVVSSETTTYLAVLLSLRAQPGLFEPVVRTERLAMFRVRR
jgi:hypothetical protein